MRAIFRLFVEIEGEARSISCLHCVDDKNMSLWKILIGVGHADDALSFSRLVGLDITSDTLKGNMLLHFIWSEKPLFCFFVGQYLIGLDSIPIVCYHLS